MKIAYIYPALFYPGGMERILTVKMNALSKLQDTHVTIITYKQGNTVPYFPLDSKVKHVDIALEEPNEVKLSQLKSAERKKIINDFDKKYRSAVEDYLLKNPFDVCISGLFGRDYTFLGSLKDGSIKIAEYHFAYDQSPLYKLSVKTNSPIQNFKNFLYRKNYVSCLQKFKKIVILTESDAKKWRKDFKQIEVIPNPVTIDNTTHFNLKPKTAIAIGSLIPSKGFDKLILAWKKVIVEAPDWQLHIYGNGQMHDLLQLQILENNMAEKIKLFPSTREISKVYNYAQLLLIPSQSESLSLVLLEAMACGLPAVAFRSAGTELLIKDKETGFLIKNGDTVAFARGILSLIKNSDKLKNFGENAFNYAQEFREEIIMEKWLSLFKRVLQNEK